MYVKINLAPIERFMAKNGMTYKAFCDHCHISTATLRKIRRKQYVRMTTMLYISINICCNLSDIVEEVVEN